MSKEFKYAVGAVILIVVLTSCIRYVTTYEDEYLREQESKLQAHTDYGDVPKYRRFVETRLYPDSLEMMKVRKREVYKVDYGEYHLEKIKIDTIPRPYPYISPLDTLQVGFSKELSGRYGVGPSFHFMGYSFIDSVHFRWVRPRITSSTPRVRVHRTESKPLIKRLGFSGKYHFQDDTLQMYEQRAGTILVDTTIWRMSGDTLFLIRTNDHSIKKFKKMFKNGQPEESRW